MANRAKQQRERCRARARTTVIGFSAIMRHIGRLNSRTLAREFQDSQRIYNQIMAAYDERHAGISGKGWRMPSYFR